MSGLAQTVDIGSVHATSRNRNQLWKHFWHQGVLRQVLNPSGWSKFPLVSVQDVFCGTSNVFCELRIFKSSWMVIMLVVCQLQCCLLSTCQRWQTFVDCYCCTINLLGPGLTLHLVSVSKDIIRTMLGLSFAGHIVLMLGQLGMISLDKKKVVQFGLHATGADNKDHVHRRTAKSQPYQTQISLIYKR